MNNMGAQIRNIEAVRDMVDTAVTKDNNIIIENKTGNQYIIIDKNTGNIKRVEPDGTVFKCMTGEESSKENGYIYLKLFILGKNNKLKEINYAQHTTVAMAMFKNEYDELVEKGVTGIVVNHLNNCPWNNEPSNLEFVSKDDNLIHACFVHSLHEYEQKHGYNSIVLKRNLRRDKYFVTIRTGLSCKEIHKYEEHLTKSKGIKNIKEYWGIKNKDSRLSNEDLIDFIEWLRQERGIKL